MVRKVTKKIESNECLTIKRGLLGLYDSLVLNKTRCVGCEICVKVCYKEALKLSNAIVHEGKLLEKGAITIDADKCTFCGMCVALCPLNAIKIFRNGKEVNPAVETELFPHILKKVAVNVEKCDPTCKLVCKESCPTEAISIKTERLDEKRITKIIDVSIELDKCIFCGKCQSSCPQEAIEITKPFQGLIQLTQTLCPENCSACVDICPSKALALTEDGEIEVKEQFCIFCGACQEVCPEKAIEVKRTRVLHDYTASRAWISALEKLTSPECVDKELGAKSMKKLIEAVRKIDRF
ncbi:MAG: 4Fe-4S binding protein [Candidatus Bathyarchaeales archaeon]